MGFKQSNAPDTIEIKATLPAFKDDDGKEVVFTFVFRQEMEDDAEKLRKGTLLNQWSDYQATVEKMAALLQSIPDGIDDWPEGDISTATRTYFKNPAMRALAVWAMELYLRSFQPRELFRGV